MASGRVKQTFMPEVEGDFMIANITLPQTTPFSRMEQVADQLDAARRALEAETAERAVADPNTGHDVARRRALVEPIDRRKLDPRLCRPHAAGDARRNCARAPVTERLEELLGEVPDADEISFSLSGSGSPRIEMALMGENKEDLDSRRRRTESAPAAIRRRHQRPRQPGRRQRRTALQLLPGAEQLGITLGDMTRQVRQAYFGEEVQRLPREGDDVRVYVRYPRDDRRTLESLGSFRVRTADGREVPLAAVATWEFAPGVTGLDRRQRISSILVTADLVNAEARTEIMRTLDARLLPGLRDALQHGVAPRHRRSRRPGGVHGAVRAAAAARVRRASTSCWR